MIPTSGGPRPEVLDCPLLRRQHPVACPRECPCRRMPESDSLAETAAWLWPAAALALGLIVGSFANVCIHRLPMRESVVSPRSRCPTCRKPIGALDNVPVLSFLFLGGRCRHCRARISWRYPAVEATNGLLYLATSLRDGLSPSAMVH